MTRVLWAVCSLLTVSLIVAAALLPDTARWLAGPVTALVAVLVGMAVLSGLLEYRRRLLRRAHYRHPSAYRP